MYSLIIKSFIIQATLSTVNYCVIIVAATSVNIRLFKNHNRALVQQLYYYYCLLSGGKIVGFVSLFFV